MILTLKVRLAKGEVQDLELKFISNQEFGCAELDDLLMQSSVWLKSAAEVQAAAEKAAAEKAAADKVAATEKAVGFHTSTGSCSRGTDGPRCTGGPECDGRRIGHRTRVRGGVACGIRT